MIRFDIKVGAYWSAVDVAEDLSLQFTKKNLLFATDDIECERSTSFSVPATPANNSLFGYGSNINTLLDRMAKRYAARMVASGVIKEGYLYVTECDTEQYNCVFVTGDLLGLKAINDLDTIKELLGIMNDTADYDAPISATASRDTLWACVKYMQNGVPGMPYASWSVKLLMDAVKSTTGVSIDTEIIGTQWRIIPKKQEPKYLFTLNTQGVANPAVAGSTTPTVDRNNIAIDSSVFVSEPAGSAPITLGYTEDGQAYYFGYMNYIRVVRDVSITFPDTIPDGLVLMSDISHSASVSGAQATFLGGYEFNFVTQKFSGTPLNGRTVALTEGTRFILYRLPQGYTTGKSGSFTCSYFSFADVGVLSCRVSLSVADGHRKIIAQDHVPDISIMDMYRHIAALRGYLVNYTDDTLMMSDSVNMVYRSIDDRVIGYSNVRAQFGDYVQRNSIELADGSEIGAYLVDNSNLEERKTLHTLPWYGGMQSGTLVVEGTDNDTLGMVYGSDYLQRPTATLNTMISALCTQRVSVQVQVSMPMYEYNRITQSTGFLWRGAYWVWTDCSWTNDVATLTLSRYR